MTDEADESCQIWNQLGEWWDNNIGDADYYHRAFIFPTIEKWFDSREHRKILDAGCGNGALARVLFKLGAGEILATDFSSTLLKKGEERSLGLPIEFHMLDLTQTQSMEFLQKKGPFDLIVSSMVLHDMATIEPFISSLKLLLKPKGFFIFSIPHPCFNMPSNLFEPKGALTVKEYNQLKTYKICSKPEQPIPQMVFHRPLKYYISLLLKYGMVLEEFEEPCVDPTTLPKGNLWSERPDLPPALLCKWGVK